MLLLNMTIRPKLFMNEVADIVMSHNWQAHIVSKCETFFDENTNSFSQLLAIDDEDLFAVANAGGWS